MTDPSKKVIVEFIVEGIACIDPEEKAQIISELSELLGDVFKHRTMIKFGSSVTVLNEADLLFPLAGVDPDEEY